jgi:hypothetical protein
MKKFGKGLGLVGIFTSLVVLPVQAGTVLQALEKCSQVENSLQRLTCYDEIVNGINKQNTLSERSQRSASLNTQIENKPPSVVVPPVITPSVVPPPVTPPINVDASVTTKAQAANKESQPLQEYFGIEEKQIKEQSVDKIYATVVKVIKNARKKRIFTLDNGQVWRQTETDSLSIKQDDIIYIERGILGSFYMSKDQVNRKFRVKRIK